VSDDPRLIEPHEIRGRSFPLSLRGFDPEDIRTFLLKVADALDALESGSGKLEDFPMPLDEMRHFEFETTWKGADREEVHQFLGEIADYAEHRSTRQTRTNRLSGGRPRLTAVSSEPTAAPSRPAEHTEPDQAHAAPRVSHDETPRHDDRPAQPTHLSSVNTPSTEAAMAAPVGEVSQAAPTNPEPTPASAADPTPGVQEHPAEAPAAAAPVAAGLAAADPVAVAPVVAAPVAAHREPDPRLDNSSVFDSEIGAILEHAKAAAAKITGDAERRAEDYFEAAKAEASTRIEEELGEARSDLARVRRDAEGIRSDAEAARKSSDEYAQRVRSEADEYAERVRSEADTGAEELRAESTEYAEETRRQADEYAAETTAEAQRLRSEAEDEVRRRVEATLAEARERLETLTAAEAEVRARLEAVAETARTLLAEPQTDLDAIIAAASVSDAGEGTEATVDDDVSIEEDSHAA
jgi:cell division septum initiation protein DivIVA